MTIMCTGEGREMDGTTVEHRTGTFKGKGGLNLFYQAWVPCHSGAVIALIHGIGEHSGRYDHVGRRFAGEGYAVFAYDHRGHGRSQGTRGHVDRFEDYLDDVDAFLALVREQNPGKKVFLYGHSMGGLIALGYAEGHPGSLGGVIVTSPCLGLTVKVPPTKAALARVLSSLLPRLALDSGLPLKYLARNQRVGEEYAKDPHVGRKVSTRWYCELVRAMAEVNARAAQLAVPVIILQGGDDHLVSAEQTIRFYEQAGTPDKRLKVYEGFYHEIHNEDDREQVFQDVLAWLVRRS